MNKKLMLVAGVVAVIVVASITYLASRNMMGQQADADPPWHTAENEQNLAGAPEPTPAQALPGAYKDYSAIALREAVGTKVLFFHAQWCPQCRQLDSEFQKSGAIPDGVSIFKVNYDTNQELRQKYDVVIQTTLIKIDDSGNMLQKFVAYDDPTLASVVKNMLQ